MSQQLISLSPDLKRLRDEGYEIEVRGGYLMAHHIPYVNSAKEIKYGLLVSELTLTNNTLTARPATHVIHFIGEHPCHKDGTLIEPIRHASNAQQLGAGIAIQHTFSNKPPTGYQNYYAKISRYADIISAPAKSMDSSVTEKTFKLVTDTSPESIFTYLDTSSSRANINLINAKFNGQKIAIIGLGGTGAYILDLVAKTPVSEIRLFDGDAFLQHNAFRSPGAASAEDLNQQLKKVEYYKALYSRMHKGIISHGCNISEANIESLEGASYIFICVDKNSVRKTIIDYALVHKIPFIDVGLGVNVIDDALIGTVRTTSGTPMKKDHLDKRISGIDPDGGENEYATNIQIADLNALNAVMAVIKWKKMSGFYQDLEQEHHSIYSLNVAQLINEDLTA